MNNNDLFLTDTPETKTLYTTMMAQTAQAVADAITDSKAYVGPVPADLQKAIAVDSLLPENGLGWDAVFERLKKQILPNFLRTSSTDYMPHLHSAVTLESVAAELILSTFNQSMDSWDQAPVATEVEVAVVQFLCQLYGYDVTKADGVFTSGGSQSNQTALILARDWFCNTVLNYDVKKHGLPENFRKMRMYTSEISHFSMEKTSHIMGMGYECVVKVPVDAHKKMDIAALKKLIAEDKAAGNIPYCVVATVGTTDFGSIDDIDAIRELCDENHMWLHADAAYGSGVILSDKYRNRVEFLKKADSITVDFHKMFMQPISCSAVLVKDGTTFDALTIHADYLNRTEDEEDGYTNLVDKSLQTTRRFDALKVWVSFQTRGKDGWSELITTCMENAQYLQSRLAGDTDFVTITEPEISSVVFRLSESFCGPEPANKTGLDGTPSDEPWCDIVNKKVRRHLIHQEGVIIGQTVSNGHVCLKFTLLNPLVSHEKLDGLLTLIKKLGKEAAAH
ncbi:MAG: aspartate aminotransferase family protein [Treponemataceae bacterium]|nr:aspartate aminotransferase family protein [Treponemataceae bacterium]